MLVALSVWLQVPSNGSLPVPSSKAQRRAQKAPFTVIGCADRSIISGFRHACTLSLSLTQEEQRGLTWHLSLLSFLPS